ncbi:uncharacterized protein BDR25DRAFT_314054 [Lindgomyces ingoldianus]|uniref:Uncharacterized protein n=1 Tax=Lindgomyces ingoldianus TaxID=673940 RepID=A0ACB6QXP6_9PLEO|nr:uncharacterized protein BDR25DRAFT_314054 [Lindgomyces ingoldianus]KAF2470857.1 hypothetical protein BDR25DRAFT_314054 [Lindgomyces ingoldianus]
MPRNLLNSALLLVFAFGLPGPSNAAWKNLTVSDYKLKQSGYSSTIASFDKALLNVQVGDIIGDINHSNPSTAPNVKHLVTSSGYSWESSSDFDDANTDKWYPQGITTSADAYEKGDFDGHRVHLVSWHSDNYDDGKRGARVAFVNRGPGGTKKYRHVLLVQPKGEDDFEAITGLHAGGILWYGTLIYVVDTTGGLRVFDLAHMYQVDGNIKDNIGKSGTKYGAYGYK